MDDMFYSFSDGFKYINVFIIDFTENIHMSKKILVHCMYISEDN